MKLPMSARACSVSRYSTSSACMVSVAIRSRIACWTSSFFNNRDPCEYALRAE